MSFTTDTPRIASLLAGLSLLLASGCAFKHEKPHYVYAPDMHFNPSLKAQKIGSMRMPPAGTIPRGFRPYEITDIEQAGRELKNPLKRTKDVMEKGQKLFNVYCIVCHGKYGEGDGLVVPAFPRPPSLQSEKIMNYPDGKIFHVITLGQTLMPSYGDRLNEEERWQVIHYVRALQRAKHPTAADLKSAEDKAD